MPKTFAQYNRYESGLNFKSDDEDLDNASLAECIGWDINNPGEVTTIGTTVLDDTKSYNVTISGLFDEDSNVVSDGKSFVVARSDFDIGSSSSSNVNLAAEAPNGNTIGFYTNERKVAIITDLEGTPSNITKYSQDHFFDLGADGNPVMFWHEGELRINDNTFNSNSVPKWFGVINRTRFTNNNAWNVKNSQWIQEDLHLKQPELPSSQSGNGNGIVYFDETSSIGKLPQVAAGMPNLIMTQTTNAEDGTWESTEYEFGITNVYKGNQESSITLMQMKQKDTENENTFNTVDSYKINPRQYFTGVNISFKNSNTDDYPQRQTGCRIYIRKAGSGRRWRLFLDVDFVKGAKRNTFDKVESGWSENTTGVYYLTSQIEIKNPSIETYEALTGTLNDEVSVAFNTKSQGGEGWGSAISVGRRVFYLRCKYYTEDQTSPTKLYDRVFYSNVGKPDVVPTGNWIDLGINDGDEFIGAETYAGRLCLFKRNKIYILNVANPNPMGWGLEQEIDNNGIPDSANVLLTRYGIIWANNYGCFMYGGQAPVELSQRIGSVEWRSHLSRNYEVLPIGFHEKTNQLFVTEQGGVHQTNTCNAWVYNFATNGWTKRKDEFHCLNNGFSNKLNGDLLIHKSDSASSKMIGYVVNVTPQSSESNTCTLVLKEDTLGSPGLKKRFYNVKVELKNENNSTLAVYGNGSLIQSKTMSANSDYVTKIFTWNTIAESDKMQLKFVSNGAGGITIGNVLLEYRPKRLRVTTEGN